MFKVGDEIRGLPCNGYCRTNEKMTRGVVVRTDQYGIMWVLIVEHKNRAAVGHTYPVSNSEKLFERI